jgi:hypothetical protein
VEGSGTRRYRKEPVSADSKKGIPGRSTSERSIAIRKHAIRSSSEPSPSGTYSFFHSRERIAVVV